MQTNTLTITIVICTRDRLNDLASCLRSIQDQSVLPESIVIVSGSNDSCTLDLLNQFSDMPITVVESYEHNISISRNVGIANTQDDIVVFIDDDAIARDGWLQAYKDIFIQNPNAWAAGGVVYDSRTNPMRHEFNQGVLNPYGTQSPVNTQIDHLLKKGYLRTVKGCNFAVRREMILSIGGLDPFFRFAYDEADLIFSVYKAGGVVAHCPQAIVDHAHTPGHYRQTGRMSHDWRVEYASHTMFMLKHTLPSKRHFGWAIILRRYLKLVASAGLSVIQREISIRCAMISLHNARDGIRDAKIAYRMDLSKPSHPITK